MDAQYEKVCQIFIAALDSKPLVYTDATPALPDNSDVSGDIFQKEGIADCLLCVTCTCCYRRSVETWNRLFEES